MKKIAVAVFTKISGDITLCIERAVYKAVFMHLSNYFEDAVYGVVIDLPDSPCYKSYGDREIIETLSRCYGALPKKYKESFFAVVRARRYNVNRTKSEAFCCENGASGALGDLISGNNEWYFALGSVPENCEYLYFSASDGVIEAGGIKALLKITAQSGENVFPYIKNAPYSDYLVNALHSAANVHKKPRFNIKNSPFNPKKKGKTFSFIEGLFIREKIRNDKSVRIGRKERDVTKGEGVLLKSVCVLNFPPNNGSGYTEAPFKRKKDYSRFSYRAALAASRFFTKIIEKNCVAVEDCIEAAECILALIAMRGFGFLGEDELLKNTDILLDIIEEKMLIGYEKKEKGRLLFLLTSVCSAYSCMAPFYPVFWSCLLRVKEICGLLETQVMSTVAEKNNVYLIMCCKKAVLDIDKENNVPKLIKIMLSEGVEDISFQGGDFNNTEDAMCVLIAASNVCFHGNIRSFILSNPIFRAKSSYLTRMNEEKSDFRVLKARNPEKNKTEAFVSSSGLLPVKDSLSQCGADVHTVPFIGYFQKLIRQIPINNYLTVVKICYIVDNNLSLLECLIKAAAATEGVSLCVIFNNSYSFAKAEKRFAGRVRLLLSDDKEKCDEVKRSSVIVRLLTSETTLSELMEDVKEYGRFKANVNSVPTVFSHCIYAGGGLKNGFCTFLQSGKNVSYGEFIKNPFTEVRSAVTTFVPRLRAKLIKVTLKDEKYKSATALFLLTEKGKVLEAGGAVMLSKVENTDNTENAEISDGDGFNGERLTVLKQSTDDGMLFAVQIYRNEKEKAYLQDKLREEGFFESCEAVVKEENAVQQRHAEILSVFLDAKLPDMGDGSVIPKLRAVMGRQLPRAFFSKLIFLSKAGELKGEKLPLAATAYAECFSDRKIFDICLPASYTRNCGEKGGNAMELKNEYRYPFYIHCLDRMKEADKGEITGGKKL